MDPARFDALTKRLATSGTSRRLSRRATLRHGAAGAAAAALGAATLAARVRAQGTPSATGGELAENNATLFVQTAASGTFVPNPPAGAAGTAAAGTPGGTPAAARGAYLLTLEGHGGQTVVFSDRPRRDFGQVATSQFFTSMGFTAANPPNAALVAGDPGQAQDVLLVELLNPSYDAASMRLTYEADVLEGYRGAELKPLAAQQRDRTLAASFGAASLFIDDCPDIVACYRVVGPTWLKVGAIPGGPYGRCFHWGMLKCAPCLYPGSPDFAQNHYNNVCNHAFDACEADCTAA